MREGFADVAVGPAISSFLETCRYLAQEGASKSHVPPARSDLEFDPNKVDQGAKDMQVEQRGKTPPTTPPKKDEHAYGVVPQGSRVVFSEEGAPGESLQVIAQGEVSDGLLEALEDFVKRQRKRLSSRVRNVSTGLDRNLPQSRGRQAVHHFL